MTANHYNKAKNLPAVAQLQAFPRRHLITIAVLTLCLCSILLFSTSKPAQAKRHTQELSLTLQPEMQELLAKPSAPIAATIIPEVEWHKETVRSGDSLSHVFQRAGLSDRRLMEFMSSNSATKSLKRIHPGHELEFLIEEGELQSLRYRPNRLSSELFTRASPGKFSHKVETRQPDVHLAYRQATIQNSLFLAGQKAKMEADLIMELANIFGWDIDFGLDIRKGDQFKVLYEERFLDGEKIGNGSIMAAEFTNQNITYQAVRYEDKNGNVHYYTPDGKSMRKAFLQAPLDFRRISSNFNPARLHPVLKTVRPHRGTDYAASTGTPVWASGDGKIVTSTRHYASGNYIVIQHSNNIQTKYLHLSKRLVNVGQRVKQGQVIGLVGTTGYSTAPHLHYEFLVDGIHRNPRTILEKLPKTVSIASSEMPRFRSSTQPLMASLKQHHQEILLASARTPAQ